jgi:hypothetical protein
MPDTQLTNPAAEESEAWSTTQEIEEYLYDPTVASTVPLTNGMVVVFYGGYTPPPTGTTSTTVVSSTAIPVIRKATTTPGAITAGVVTNAPTGGYLPGSVVQVVRQGIAQVLCDANNTTFGQYLIQGSTTAGAATASASATAHETIGVCLATTTIGSGTALVYAYVEPNI